MSKDTILDQAANFLLLFIISPPTKYLHATLPSIMKVRHCFVEDADETPSPLWLFLSLSSLILHLVEVAAYAFEVGAFVCSIADTTQSVHPSQTEVIRGKVVDLDVGRVPAQAEIKEHMDKCVC